MSTIFGKDGSHCMKNFHTCSMGRMPGRSFSWPRRRSVRARASSSRSRERGVPGVHALSHAMEMSVMAVMAMSSDCPPRCRVAYRSRLQHRLHGTGIVRSESQMLCSNF